VGHRFKVKIIRQKGKKGLSRVPIVGISEKKKKGEYEGNREEKTYGKKRRKEGASDR